MTMFEAIVACFMFLLLSNAGCFMVSRIRERRRNPVSLDDLHRLYVPAKWSEEQWKR